MTYLNELLQEVGISKVKLAKYLGVSRQMIYNYLELKEELNVEFKPDDLQFIKTLKKSTKVTETFINNEFNDLYIVRTDKKIEEMKFQEEEISEIMYVPYKQFKKMVKDQQPDLLRHDDEFEILFNIFDDEFDK